MNLTQPYRAGGKCVPSDTAEAEPMPTLFDFFQKPLYERALTAYARFALSRRWPIEHKLEMYNWAKAAFDSELEEAKKSIEFGRIYNSLQGYWQVFRNARGGHWRAHETFEALTEHCAALSRRSGITLMTLHPDSEASQSLFVGLSTLRNLKRTRWYPYMPVAKFTHFFNPSLFPIYDTDVIWNKVLNDQFRCDYRQWCKTLGVNPNGQTELATFNVTYTLMAAHVMQSADGGFMDFFGEWFRQQVTDYNDERHVLSDVSHYYATAFECVAIGAAHL
jgi:hypothetical protein